MDANNVAYQRADNCFTWIEDPVRAQCLMEELLHYSWADILNQIAKQVNPVLDEIFQHFKCFYYWSVYQSEWATDIIFKKAESLARIYPHLLRYGLTTFLNP